MITYLSKRLAITLVLLFVLSAIIYLLQSISPGDPVKAYLGANASSADVLAERHRLGLDQPTIVRFARFLAGLIHGDLGVSFRTHRPVLADFSSYLPATIELVVFAFLLTILMAVIFAFSAALRIPGGSVYRGILLIGATAPPFLLAIGGIVLFYQELDWLPASGQGPDDPGPTGFLVIDTLAQGNMLGLASTLQHLLLPGLVLAIAPAISIGRILRSSLESTLSADYVRTARSKGLGRGRVLMKHVLRNSIGPAISMSGLQLGFMFAGVVVVEQVFSWPGIGNYLASSIPVSDFPAIAGVTLVLGTIYIITNAVVDLLQAAADPRLTV
jgi:peptide/nickel transport system permease protein